MDKYIGESARLVREMFAYAREHEPCIIFMDEIDAIGGRRFSEGTSADREIQRTLMEVSKNLSPQSSPPHLSLYLPPKHILIPPSSLGHIDGPFSYSSACRTMQWIGLGANG